MQKRLFILIAFLSLMLTADAQKMGLVKGEGGITNIRKGPGVKFEIVRKIGDGNCVHYEDMGNGWCKVYDVCMPCEQNCGFLGYMAKSKIVPPPMDCESWGMAVMWPEDNDFCIRKGPGKNYSVAEKIKPSAHVLFGDEENGWCKIFTQQGKLRGYMAFSQLWPDDQPSKQTFIEVNNKYK